MRIFMHKTLENFLWLFSDRILKMAFSLFVGIWIVRYFGPEFFGKFNFVSAWVLIVSSIIPLGTESIIIADFLHKDSDHKEILSSAFFLFSISSIVFSIFTLLLIYLTKPYDFETMYIAYLLVFPMLFRGFAVPRYYFESILKMKYVVLLENMILVVSGFIKLLFLFLNFPVIYLVYIFSFESLLSVLFVYLFYGYKHSFFGLKSYSAKRMVELLKGSFPLFLSSLSVILYMKIDQIMIGNMMGDTSLGIYSVAVKISEMWYFVPMAVASSFYPQLIKLFSENYQDYYFQIRRLHILLLILSLMAAFFIQFFGNEIVFFLYGVEFKESANILKIHVWSGIFVFLGVAGANDLIIRKIQRFSMYKSFLGLVINVCLNIFFIPNFGLVGAAVATLISQIFASSFFYILFKDTRVLFRVQLEALLFWKYNEFLLNKSLKS